MEQVFTYADHKAIEEMKLCRSFIGPEALSLFIGRKYLNAALITKDKKD